MKKKIVYFSQISCAPLADSPADADWPDAAVHFAFAPAELPAYGNPLAASLQFSVPSADILRVAAWFSGNYDGVTEPASDTLVRNYTTAVRALLNTYFDAVSAASLCASPLLVAWRFRLFDGSAVMPKPPAVVIPDGCAEGPLLPVIGHALGDRTLRTDVEILSNPSRLTFSMPPLAVPDAYRDAIAAVELLAGKPVPLYSPTCNVYSPRTQIIDGLRRQCWVYDRFPAAQVEASAAAASLRVVGSVPIEEAMAGITSPRELPLTAADTPAGEDDAEPWSPTLRIATEPLHLDLPERPKRVASVTLRGVFDRSGVRMRLYGAHHRPNPLRDPAAAWRLISSADGPCLTALTGPSVRWLRLELELTRRPGDFLDYLVFTYC